MNPSHGWNRPPPGGPHYREGEQPPSHRQGPYGPNPGQSGPHGGPQPGIPSTSGHFVPYQQQPQHTLPPIMSQGSPRNHPSHAPPPPTSHHAPYTSGNGDIMDPNDRDAREVHIKEEQDAAIRRERDMRERQMLDHMHIQQQAQGAPIQLHQPVAVGPRTVHGPNGLLGNPAVVSAGMPQPQHMAPQMAAPSGFSPQMQHPLPVQQPYAQAPASAAPPPPPPSQQQQAVPTASQASASGSGQQPILNDALSYLDQVKVQFSEHPDVYNRFLDIMKDFKSGAIDTPGVIDRVSTLFTGSPDLIQGFNTFLPPGYRIECGTGDDPNAIRVTTPTGNTVMAMSQGVRHVSTGPESLHVGPGQHHQNGAWTPQPGQQPMFSPNGRPVGPVVPHGTPEAGQQMGGGVRKEGLDGVPGEPDDKKEPLEFNHAINYVNKIKNRFATQPDIYKSFLDILQTYQRESRPIQEVYAQVTKLFESAPDLLEDFKQFLPDTTAKAKAAAAKRKAEDAITTSNVRGDGGPKNAAQLQKTPRADQRLPPVGNFAPTPTANKDHKRKRGDTKSGMGSISSETKVGPAPGAVGAASKKTKVATGGARPLEAPVSPTLVPALPQPLRPTTKSSATQEELGFFDRVKKTIANKNTMNEFLKLCNLFNQDLIDKTTLVYRARGFLGGHPDLFKWFTTWIKYEDPGDVVVEQRLRQPTGRVMLSNCRGLGPSYRLLPKRERLKPCSGRDELCNEVLNDAWASHPTWASEDSGFIAHRKNVHEEGLHKIEEERHDYDFHIEALGRTIQLLEPFAQQLLRMNERERETLELPPGIGGQSQTIHKRIIMKIYGRPDGREVIEHLHSRPYAVIPVLLNRLKQKHEEWKNAQREWEKVWRDQTQKIFWKSLDHQAVNAKQADKRQFQTKTLLAEILAKYEEQKVLRLHGGTMTQVTKPQLTFNVEDIDVVVDACCLVLTYADQFHSTEYPRLTSFVRDFIPQFFGLDVEWFNHQVRVKTSALTGEDAADEVMSNYDESTGSRRRAPAKKEDLRRGVLNRGRGRNDGAATPISRASTPDPSARLDEEMSEAADVSAEDADAASDIWAEYPSGHTRYKNREIHLNEPYKRSTFNLYGNTSIYCFIRMFVILYERLVKLKAAEHEVHETVRRATMSKPAIDLGLIDKQPTDFFAVIGPSANYYTQALGMFTDLLRGNDVEMSHIEEMLRRYYLQSGWQLYSLDKLLGALVRFAIVIMSSDARDRSWEVLQLFKKDRARDETTYQEEMNYRKQTERLIKDGDTYKIAYNQDKQHITMKIFKKDEPTFDVSEMMAEEVWRIYVTDYLSTAPTHGVPTSTNSGPVLMRDIRAVGHLLIADEAAADAADGTRRRVDTVSAKEAQEFRISVGEYKLAFETDAPANDEYWSQPEGVRVADAAAAGGARGLRGETAAESLVMNNAAMKGLGRDVVDGHNEAFRTLCEGGGASAPAAAAAAGNERPADDDAETRMDVG